MPVLDRMDRRILYQLDGDARAPSSRIAKKLRTSPQVVDYRLKNLVRRGAIWKFCAFINYRKLGFGFHHIYYKLQYVDEKVTEEFISHLKSLPNIGFILRSDGKWDLSIGVIARDSFQFDDIAMGISTKFHKYIKEYAMASHIGAYHFRRNYLVSENEREETSIMPLTGAKEEQAKLAKEDLALLLLLNENARISSFDASKSLGWRPEVVRYRLRKLFAEKFILGSMALPDYAETGLLLYRVLVRLRYLTETMRKKMLSYLGSIPNVVRVVRAFGAYELLVDVEVERAEELRGVMMAFRSRFSEVFEDYDALLVYKIDKFNYFPDSV